MECFVAMRYVSAMYYGRNGCGVNRYFHYPCRDKVKAAADKLESVITGKNPVNLKARNNCSPNLLILHPICLLARMPLIKIVPIHPKPIL